MSNTLNHEQLVDELRQALVHLDDPPYLENMPLARRIPRPEGEASLSRGQALRRALRLAIASLDPGVEAVGNPLKARAYQVLYSYAISKQSMVAIASSLGISRRQGYRELNEALHSLANILSDSLEQTTDDLDQGTNDGDQLAQEVERLTQAPHQYLSLGDLQAEVIQNAHALASRRKIELVHHMPENALMVTTNRVLLRQAILNLLSHMISVHSGPRIETKLRRQGEYACLSAHYCPAQPDHPPSPRTPYAVAMELFDRLDIRCRRYEQTNGVTMRLQIPLSRQVKVLIIDDNRGMLTLLTRFLNGHPYMVEGAENLEEALDKLDSLHPDVIILDIMLPDHDGWEILQQLRSREEAESHAAIIICSVVNDPGLAAALGADAFLAKPVERQALLRTLDQVLSST